MTVPMLDDHYRLIRWLTDELARWTYKPGFTFEVLPPDSMSYLGMARVRITAYLPDSRRETVAHPPVREWDAATGETRLRTERKLIPISQTVAVPPYLDSSDEFARWFSSVLMDLEHHEHREWLCRDGEIFDDPHKPREASRA